jgi:hypothetical protein
VRIEKLTFLTCVLLTYGSLGSAQGSVINSLNPSSATVGSPALTLNVNGTNFVAGSVLYWDNTALSTTFVSATQLVAFVPASLVGAIVFIQDIPGPNAGPHSVTVLNPDNSSSNAGVFALFLPPQYPTIISFSPPSVPIGGPALTLLINGTGFVSGAVVYMANSALSPGNITLLTSFVSATQLAAMVPANLTARLSTISVTVVNPDGGMSNAVPFNAASTLSALTVVTPSTLPSGAVGNAYSQALSARGGTAPYSWSLVSGTLPSGLSLSSSGAIMGTPTAAGTLAFTARVMDAASATATQAFSLTIGTSLTFTSALRVPQILDGAGWKTRFAVINTDQVPVTFTFQFWGDDGMALPFAILNGNPGVLSGTLAPGASFFAQSPGVSSTQQQGWAEVASSGRIGVTAIYQFSVGGPRDSLATEIAAPSGDSILMSFDNTLGNVTAVAIANTNPTQSLTVSMLFETDGGLQNNSSMVLQPHAHVTFVVPLINPAVAGFRGSIQFTAPSPDMAVVGVEFTSTGQFTSLGTFQ